MPVVADGCLKTANFGPVVGQKQFRGLYFVNGGFDGREFFDILGGSTHRSEFFERLRRPARDFPKNL